MTWSHARGKFLNLKALLSQKKIKIRKIKKTLRFHRLCQKTRNISEYYALRLLLRKPILLKKGSFVEISKQ
jgi:hypothetical protein